MASGDAWSHLTRILPFIEQANTYLQVDFNLAANVQDAVTRQRIAIFICPSETQDEMKAATSTTGPGAINRYPSNYAANLGTWMVWNPNTGQGGDGAITYTSTLNGGNKTGDFLGRAEQHDWLRRGEGLSLAAQVERQPAGRHADPGSDRGRCSGSGRHARQHAERAHFLDRGADIPQRVHVRAAAEHAGDLQRPHRDRLMWTNCPGNEGSSATRISYDAVTSRSYHSGGVVNVLLMDGSVRTVTSSIDPFAWRAAGTRDGGEVIGLP